MRTCTTPMMPHSLAPRYRGLPHVAVGFCPTRAGVARSGRQLVLERVADQLRAGVEAQVLEDASAVPAHGLRGDGQLDGDLAHGPPGADQAPHLVLAVRQRLVCHG